MRAREFIRENTVSGGIATVSVPLGGTISRAGISKPAKYMNSINPVKRKKTHARG